MKRYKIDYKRRNPQNNKLMVTYRIINAESAEEAAEAFNKQVPGHEGIVTVWEEALTTIQRKITELRRPE